MSLQRAKPLTLATPRLDQVATLLESFEQWMRNDPHHMAESNFTRTLVTAAAMATKHRDAYVIVYSSVVVCNVHHVFVSVFAIVQQETVDWRCSHQVPKGLMCRNCVHPHLQPPLQHH